MFFRGPMLPIMFRDTEELFGFLVLVLIIVVIVKAARRSHPRGARRRFDPPPTGEPAAPEEDELLRRLCAQLDKMERRLDNLETILLDKNESRKP